MTGMPAGRKLMYDNWVANATVVAATLTVISLAVLLHYEGLLFVSRTLQRIGGPQRVKVLYGIFSRNLVASSRVACDSVDAIFSAASPSPASMASSKACHCLAEYFWCATEASASRV